MATSIVDKFISAAFWSAGTAYIFFALNFLGQMFLARLLLPHDFGLYAYIFALKEFLLIFTGFITTQSLLYTDVSQQQFNASFIINLAGCAILLLLSCMAWVVFIYKGQPINGAILIFLVIAQILTTLSYLYTAPLEKALNYKTVSLTQGSAGVIGMVAAIVNAKLTHSMWSLVLRDVISGFIVFAFAYHIAPKKFSGTCNTELIKAQLKFGIQTALSRGLEILCYKFPDIIIQKFFGKYTLGNFYQARYLCYLPMKLLTPFTQQILFSFFTNINNDKQEISKNLFWINYSVVIVIVPITLAVYQWGDYFIYFLYGEKWLSAGVYLRYFALFILFGSLFNMMQSACYSMALQKHVSIAFLLGILTFISGLSIISKPELSALIFSLGFMVAYLYLMLALNRYQVFIPVTKIYLLPTLVTIVTIFTYNFLPNVWQVMVFTLIIACYFILEKHNIRKLLKRVIKI